MARIVAARLAVERVELPRPLCRTSPRVLLFAAVGLDPPSSLVDREAAEFVGLGTGLGDSRASILGVAVRADRAHPELVATSLVGSELADQQRQAFLLVPPLRRLVSGARGFDSAVGLGHAGVALGSSYRCLRRPCR